MRNPARPASAAIAGLLLAASPAWAHMVTLRADLTGAQEVPNPGPPTATGIADVVSNEDVANLCYDLLYSGIGPVTMAHIHRGAAGVAGPVVVNLDVARNGDRACVAADPAVLGEIEMTPDRFYVNLHTADFPAGAMRGQLAPKS